ncbi:MAG: hypothetical protein KatS3mg102_0887 [Planctomycetota bacterium]|nr:MAG: hypothetical protein KatS3mg102_0887 [Planctomycetota bacterium]
MSARLQAETGLGALRQRAVSAIASAALRWRRRRPLLALATALVLLAGAAAVPLLGFQLFPKADRDMLIVRVEMPKGAALEATDATAERVRAALAELPETAHVVAYVGRAVSHFYYNLPHTETVNEVAQVLWIGRTGPGLRTPEQLAHELRQQLPRVVPEAAVAVREIEQGPLIQAPVVLRLRGDDVEVLRREAAKLRALLRQVPGIVEVHDSYGDDAHALEVDLDLDKARPLGLSRADVAATLAVLLSGASPTVVREGDEDRPVVIRLPRAQRRDIAMLEKLYLRAPLTGALVPLRHVARLRLGTALARIERYDQVRSIDVEAWIEGRVASHVNRDVAALLAQHYRLPAGYELEQAGERKEINESFRRLGIAALFALLFVYVILVAQFDSLVQPAVILSVLPPALAAGMLGLALTGNPIGFFAGVGCASLAGIVVNDGILLLQFINEARASGLPLEEAIDQGTVRRVKPILSTTLTTVGGLLPLAIGGGSLYAPMCTVIICGLLASTAATLVLLPWVYELSDRFVQLAVPSLRRARVLVIDDEPDAIEMLKDLLGERYEVEGTTDPEHAFKLVASFEPDAVVLDYMMPGRDGLELAAVLRELRPGVAIVMLTAYAGTRVTRSGLTHDLGAEAVLRGADAFVSKDDLPEVPAVIEAALVRPPARLAGRLARRLKRLFGGMGRG